jgi:hypothetical protein
MTAEHINDFKINYETNKRILRYHHEHELVRTQLSRGDILITIKGKIGNAAVIEDLPELVNINQDVALVRLNPEINPYYIAGFLNSRIGKLLVQQSSTGQINPFLSLGSLRDLLIQIFDNKRMNELGFAIKTKLDEAYIAAYQSKNLLEIAKTGVEKAIEENEEVATNWINQQLKNLEIKNSPPFLRGAGGDQPC